MNRSKGTYLQGVIEAERLIEECLETGQEYKFVIINEDQWPSNYYDGKYYCEGWHDYMNYFLDNEELSVYTKTKK